eukprot:s182_g8.t1
MGALGMSLWDMLKEGRSYNFQHVYRVCCQLESRTSVLESRLRCAWVHTLDYTFQLHAQIWLHYSIPLMVSVFAITKGYSLFGPGWGKRISRGSYHLNVPVGAS